MSARTAAAALAVVALVVAGCSQPQRWEERGFPSEEACWRHHGYTGGVASVSDFNKYQFWCGPIEDD